MAVATAHTVTQQIAILMTSALAMNLPRAWNFQQKRIEALLAEHDADKALIAELGGYLKNAHAFIENTEAFGQEAASGILKCGGEEWNVDASKNALAAAGITLAVGQSRW
jgi:hypothetical protein